MRPAGRPALESTPPSTRTSSCRPSDVFYPATLRPGLRRRPRSPHSLRRGFVLRSRAASTRDAQRTGRPPAGLSASPLALNGPGGGRSPMDRAWLFRCMAVERPQPCIGVAAIHLFGRCAKSGYHASGQRVKERGCRIGAVDGCGGSFSGLLQDSLDLSEKHFAKSILLRVRAQGSADLACAAVLRRQRYRKPRIRQRRV